MKPNYNDVQWLRLRWRSRDLAEWSDSEVRARAEIVATANAKNDAIYRGAAADLERQRTEFHALYRKNHQLPSYLSQRVARPPDFTEQWNRLVKRRNAELKRRAREQQAEIDRAEQKREDFRDRMAWGKIDARERRERAVRDLIAKKAAACGIVLTERSTDARLGELLNQLERAAVVEIADPPPGPMNIV